MRAKSFRSFCGCRLASAILAMVVAAVAAPARADTLVFDNMSNGQAYTSTGSTPNTFMGGAYNLTAGTTSISGMDLYPVNLSGTNFTGLKINIYIWGGVNTGTVSATAPAFSNLLGSYSLTSSGTYTTGFFYSFGTTTAGSTTPGINFGTPLTIPSTLIGLTLNIQGTTDGTTYNSVNSLTSIISDTAAPSIGTNEFNGYYRNANSETNGNFTSTLRSLGLTNQSVGVRFYTPTVVPEPGLLMLGSALVLGAFQRFRRSRLAI